MIAYAYTDHAFVSHQYGWADLSTVKNLALVPIVTPWLVVVPMWVFNTLVVVLAPRLLRWIRAKLKGQSLVGFRLKEGVWIIHGRKYNLAEFENHHPGGSWALQLGRNRDCTGLFESYHVFSDMRRLDKILARYELPESKENTVNILPHENSTGLVFRDAFHEDVKQMARDYFKSTSTSHKMKPWVFCFVIVAFVGEIVCAVAILYGYRMALVVMPLLGSVLTFHSSHDASHFALSSRPRINSIFATLSTPLYFNSAAWYIQHVVQHHVYTNDEPDVDLYHFLPIARTTRFNKWKKAFHLQGLLIWLALPTTVAHLMYVVPMDLMSRNIDLITGTLRYQECENVGDLVAGFCYLSICYSIASAIFISCTQGAHLQEQCMVSKESEDRSWAKRQVLTAVALSPSSRFWWLATGGLNLQALHHVMPSVSASHLCDMYPKFKEVCLKHNVELKEAAGWREFFGGFLSWVSELANQDPTDDVKAKVS